MIKNKKNQQKPCYLKKIEEQFKDQKKIKKRNN